MLLVFSLKTMVNTGCSVTFDLLAPGQDLFILLFGNLMRNEVYIAIFD